MTLNEVIEKHKDVLVNIKLGKDELRVLASGQWVLRNNQILECRANIIHDDTDETRALKEIGEIAKNNFDKIL